MRNINCRREMLWMGKDLVICIQNEDGHIGSVVTAQPYKKQDKVHVTLSAWNQLSHKDDMVASLYAKQAALCLQQIVTCVCGIHIDDICEEELQAILTWVHQDVEKMKQEVKQ